jgi:hypothetical protein
VDVEFFGTVVDGHVAAETVVFGIGEQLVHEVGELEASLEVHAGFAVLAEGNVGGMQGTGGANGYAFFACGDLVMLVFVFRELYRGMYHIETQSALPLCFEHE